MLFLLSANLFQNKLLRPNKKLSVFRLTDLKSLGRVGPSIFFLIISFSGKKYNFFKMHKIIFFPENLKQK